MEATVKIAVIGTGYVGLVTGTCLAESGNEVIGIDRDHSKLEILEKGRLPIYEPGLLELVDRNRREERLRFSTDFRQVVRQSSLVFIAVGTPQNADGAADLQNIWSVADQIADAANGPKIVIMKSTVPVGTNYAVGKRVQTRTSHALSVVSNPEFLKEGAAVDDFMRPDRVVVGVRNSDVVPVLQELYAPFLRTEHPFLVMSPESAEMTKYVANAMLATKVSFINEMANLCERTGADINDVRRGIGHDARIGFQFLFPGAGYGGSCFPKDVRALMAIGREKSVSLALTAAVDQVNEAQKLVLFDKIKAHYRDLLSGRTLSIWGLAFKPRTDDIREAPALALIDRLLAHEVHLRVHDPEAMPNVRGRYGDRLTYCDRPYGALEGSDGLAIVTEWQEFRNPDFEVMRRLMRQPVIFDGRNLYDPRLLAQGGFRYYSIGREPAGTPPHD
jgi:UDPglucose 6-dehydrogenase